jgi:hypothetical protein
MKGENPMAGPTTVFDADECQALLDLIDKIVRDGGIDEATDEETRVFAKLRVAGQFYIQETS